MKLKVNAAFVRDGEMLPPWYYGYAYLEYCSVYHVFYPIPINYFVRLWRYGVNSWNLFRSRAPHYDRRVREALYEEHAMGYQKGYRAALQRHRDIH